MERKAAAHAVSSNGYPGSLVSFNARVTMTIGEIWLALALLALFLVSLVSVRVAYCCGVTDGYGYSKEPNCPGYAKAGDYLKAVMSHRWPELKQPAQVRRCSLVGVYVNGVPIEWVVMGVTKAEVVCKVTTLVNTTFGGDFKKAFDHYARGGSVAESAVMQILADAGVGSGIGARLVRYAAAGEIIDLLDTDGDGAIQWPEFNAVFTGRIGVESPAEPTEADMMAAYNAGKQLAHDQKKGMGTPNPYPDGSKLQAEFHRGWRDNVGY